MPEPFFSVVIPTLNEERYIDRLLECLLEQKEKNFETIVVDGRSRDQTVKKARQYEAKMPHLRVLVSELANVSLQRNLGAAHARGRYLVFFDADAQMGPDFLKAIKKEILRRKLKLVTTYLAADSDDMADQLMVSLSNVICEVALLVGQPMANGGNTIVDRKTFFAIGQFNPKIHVGEDIDLVQQAYKHGLKLVTLPEPKLMFSLRRFRREGRLSVLHKYTKGSLYMLLKGPITEELFHYPMGGALYRNGESKKKRAIRLTRKLNQSVKTLLHELTQV